MSKEFTKEQNRKIKKLIKSKCANYCDDNCIALDEGEGCCCVQMISNHFMCNYFKNAVLPNDEILEMELTGISSKDRCVLCKKPIIKTNNRKIYCAECAKRRLRFQQAEYARKKSLKNSKNRG